MDGGLRLTGDILSKDFENGTMLEAGFVRFPKAYV